MDASDRDIYFIQDNSGMDSANPEFFFYKYQERSSGIEYIEGSGPKTNYNTSLTGGPALNTKWGAQSLLFFLTKVFIGGDYIDSATDEIRPLLHIRNEPSGTGA